VSAKRPEETAERVDAEGLRKFMRDVAAERTLGELVFLCIGTDRSTGDSLGPWVGTLLEERGFPGVVGTLRRPCDALSLPKLVRELPRDRRIVAIDACLGREESVGAYLVKKGPIVPARSVNGGFGGVGDYSVAGVVNANGPKPYWTLQSTSLYRVMEMAKEMAAAIASQWPDRI